MMTHGEAQEEIKGQINSGIEVGKVELVKRLVALETGYVNGEDSLTLKARFDTVIEAQMWLNALEEMYVTYPDILTLT